MCPCWHSHLQVLPCISVDSSSVAPYVSYSRFQQTEHVLYLGRQVSSVAQSLFATPWTAACQASLSITNSQTYSNSCPSSRWCHPTISFSVVPFSSYPQSFPASGSFPMSHFFISGGQSIGTVASSSVLPMNIQNWFLLGWTGLLCLQAKGFSRVFSNTTVQNHQFFSAQLSLWFNSHIHTWLLKNHSFDYTRLITWITALSNSRKLWAMLCRVTQDRRVMAENSDKMWSTGEGSGKPLQHSCLENSINSMKRLTDIVQILPLPVTPKGILRKVS